ncbi:MAG TPA: RNA polymerase sigma-70 factor [Bacteroidales bacterium]|nr:RNA polymerase sigma-70 factor [Bacteroidales bacterium]
MSKEKPFESELVRLIKRGEQTAFEILFRLHYNALMQFANTYVKRLDIADEIVQETFIKIWEIRSSIDEDRSVKAFLYKCVHNNCLNYIRNEKKHVYLSADFISELEGRFQLIDDNASNSYFDHLASEELSALVHDAIMQLPDQCREIFLLCRFHKQSYQEIATKLGISVNTVKTQLSRAMAKLNDTIKSVVKNF